MNELKFEIKGNIVDVVAGRIFQGTVVVNKGKVEMVREEAVAETQFILPGLIDAHIHIESSMLVPSEFARLAVVHGTVATVSDPHEIANVLGIPGVKFMIANGQMVPFKFNFGAPSCVPATIFETAGATLGVEEVAELLGMPEVKYLSEMMNFPGVLFGDPEVAAKLSLAKNAGKPVDGHAPGLMGEQVELYIKSGISTDHECFTIEEAHEKIRYGMNILIREGSAAKNFETLCSLIDEFPGRVMLCSDDKHPDDLMEGHINVEVKRAIAKGLNVMNVLRSCTLNPVRHYKLDVGLLQTGDAADFIIVDDLDRFNVMETYINGVKVAERGQTYIESCSVERINNFQISPVHKEQIAVKPAGERIKVMQALEGQLITPSINMDPKIENGFVIADPSRDMLKLVVVNRYENAPPAVAFITNFGLKHGAIASCVAHDSHNIVAVGVDDAFITEAINMIIEAKGGVSLVSEREKFILPLPVAGIMTDQDGFQAANQYRQLDLKVKDLGATLAAPFMTLSFMSLLVIPELKLSDKGLFDGNKFCFTNLFEN